MYVQLFLRTVNQNIIFKVTLEKHVRTTYILKSVKIGIFLDCCQSFPNSGLFDCYLFITDKRVLIFDQMCVVWTTERYGMGILERWPCMTCLI